MSLSLRRIDAKTFRLAGLNFLLADSLQRLPEILAQRDTEAAQQRLFPAPSTDRSLNADWQEYVGPELRHLFVSAAQTVVLDLTTLALDPRTKNSYRVSIPAAHLDAWMCALNQARLILAACHDITEADMASHQFDLEQPRGLALLRIEAYAYVLELLVRKASGPSHSN